MLRKIKEIVTGYIPRKWQKWFHSAKKRFNVLVVHRRGGKSVGVINDMIDEALAFDKVDERTGVPYKNPQYAYLATTRKQAEDIAWSYFKEYMKDIPSVKFHETKLRITFPHPRGTCTIYLLGTDNFEAIRGYYFDGYVLDEYGDMHPDVREKVMRPTISDRKGWEIIIGTPKGDNQFKKIFDHAKSRPDTWTAIEIKASESGLIDEEELEELRETMSESAFAQEYECDWEASPEGYYYQNYIQQAMDQGRITDLPYDRNYGVMTFWDLGMNDAGVIWFVQEVGRALHVIDYIENTDVGLEWYVEELHERDYKYVGHWLPHDVMVRDLTNHGRTRKDYLENLGLKDIHVVPKSQNVNEDTHAVRVLLRKCWFDKMNTVQGLEALKGYRRKWDPKNKVYMNNPVHDWASHGSDGFRQLAMSYEEGMGTSLAERYNSLPQEADHEYNILDDF